jgi:hypothetical protein
VSRSQIPRFLLIVNSIDHAPGQHDDVVNAAAGALTLAHQVGATAAVDLEPTEEELRQLRALQHEWGLGGAPIYDAAGRRYEDNVVW